MSLFVPVWNYVKYSSKEKSWNKEPKNVIFKKIKTII